MRAYLVVYDIEAGRTEAARRGWTALSRVYYATDDKNTVVLVNRPGDIQPAAVKTVLIKGPDYDSGPSASQGAAAAETWARHRTAIDLFVAEGNGEWVENI